MTQPDARQPARDRILGTAFRLFYAHGPRGVGVDTVIAESGVAKATLYKHFPRKDDLVLAYLDQVDQTWFAQLRAGSRAQITRSSAGVRGRYGYGTAVHTGGSVRLLWFVHLAVVTV